MSINKIKNRIVTISDKSLSLNIWSQNIISQSIIDNIYNGTFIQNGIKYSWNSYESNSYLEDKIEILISTGSVVFEHNQNIYQIDINSGLDFEYNIYTMDDFINGDLLEAIDGGICSGSEIDAIYMAIN